MSGRHAEGFSYWMQDETRRRPNTGGRTVGTRHGRAKLTLDAVAAIRQSTASIRVLATQYGVSAATVWAARRGHTWYGAEAARVLRRPDA